MMRTAMLQIRDGHWWEFRVNPLYGGHYVHSTRYASLYAIMHVPERGIPFLVARRAGGTWHPWGGALGARRIEFSGGGVYCFPGWSETRRGK